MRWEFDASVLTTGRVLWRMANALRVLTILTLLTDKGVLDGWLMEHDGVLLAADDPDRHGTRTIVAEPFAQFVAGELGREAFAEFRSRFEELLRREDAATLESERRSTLVATFIQDQLSVRPPISVEEIDRLKRRLGL